MGRLRTRLERLEREAEGEMVFVSQRDGTVARFPNSALQESFMTNRERTAVYDGWWRCETLEDVEEQERLVDRYAERNSGMVDQSDAAIARELLKMQRRAIERHGGP